MTDLILLLLQLMYIGSKGREVNFRCPATVRQLSSRITTHNAIHQRLREIADEV